MVQGLAFLSKKSWHTKNLANQEKVWMAEQQKEAEVAKTKELAKQIQQEREQDEMERISGKKSSTLDRGIDWMYQGGGSNTELAKQDAEKKAEEYLLGKEFVGGGATAGDFDSGDQNEGINAVVATAAGGAAVPEAAAAPPSSAYGPAGVTAEVDDDRKMMAEPSVKDRNESFRLRVEDPMFQVSQRQREKDVKLEKKKALYERVVGTLAEDGGGGDDDSDASSEDERRKSSSKKRKKKHHKKKHHRRHEHKSSSRKQRHRSRSRSRSRSISRDRHADRRRHHARNRSYSRSRSPSSEYDNRRGRWNNHHHRRESSNRHRYEGKRYSSDESSYYDDRHRRRRDSPVRRNENDDGKRHHRQNDDADEYYSHRRPEGNRRAESRNFGHSDYGRHRNPRDDDCDRHKKPREDNGKNDSDCHKKRADDRYGLRGDASSSKASFDAKDLGPSRELILKKRDAQETERKRIREQASRRDRGRSGADRAQALEAMKRAAMARDDARKDDSDHRRRRRDEEEKEAPTKGSASFLTDMTRRTHGISGEGSSSLSARVAQNRHTNQRLHDTFL